MNAIPVIVADLSPLSRLGLISLLNQTRYPLHIREITVPEKLYGMLNKDLSGLLLISSSFLIKCTGSLIDDMKSHLKSTTCMLIHDREEGIHYPVDFVDSIDFSDHDKMIVRKLEKQLARFQPESEIPQLTEEISQREKEVLQLVAIGLTNKEIAEKLFISSHTVITHRKNISAKLGIKTIAGLTMYALINKLIIPEELNRIIHD
jgi:DNA-binding CsgD family transcriptional regulator